MKWICEHCTFINEFKPPQQGDAAEAMSPSLRVICYICSKSAELQDIKFRPESPPPAPTWRLMTSLSKLDDQRRSLKVKKGAFVLQSADEVERDQRQGRPRPLGKLSFPAPAVLSFPEETPGPEAVKNERTLSFERWCEDRNNRFQKATEKEKKKEQPLFRMFGAGQRTLSPHVRRDNGPSPKEAHPHESKKYEQSFFSSFARGQRTLSPHRGSRSSSEEKPPQEEKKAEQNMFLKYRFSEHHDRNRSKNRQREMDERMERAATFVNTLGSYPASVAEAVKLEATDRDLRVFQVSVEPELDPIKTYKKRTEKPIAASRTKTGECPICCNEKQLLSVPMCKCFVCSECLCSHIETGLLNHQTFAEKLNCPLCSKPDKKTLLEPSCQYFPHLRTLLSKSKWKPELMQMFDDRLRDWNLGQINNFCNCSACPFRFEVSEHYDRNVRCPSCGKETCWKCGKAWLEEHRGISCKDYGEWLQQNDAGQSGLDEFVSSRCIHCPNCGLQFELSRGGCLHMKCRQCGGEFCSDCLKLFVHGECCPNKGLHCHHGNECIENYRDWPIDKLRKLATERGAEIDSIVVSRENNFKTTTCGIQEQKDSKNGALVDAPCGLPISEGGMCEKHFKEALVSAMRKLRLQADVKNRPVVKPVVLVPAPQQTVAPPRPNSFNNFLHRYGDPEFQSPRLSESPSRERSKRIQHCPHCTVLLNSAPRTTGGRILCQVCGKTFQREESVSDSSD